MVFYRFLLRLGLTLGGTVVGDPVKVHTSIIIIL